MNKHNPNLLSKRVKISLTIASLCQLRSRLCFVDTERAADETPGKLADIFFNAIVDKRDSYSEIEERMERLEIQLKKSGYKSAAS